MGRGLSGDVRPGLRRSYGLSQGEGHLADDERGGHLVKDEPVVVHCYTRPTDIQDGRNLAELGSFCRMMGREAGQGEVGLVIGDEYFAIRDFAEE
jgi:hypothetical protein